MAERDAMRTSDIEGQSLRLLSSGCSVGPVMVFGHAMILSLEGVESVEEDFATKECAKMAREDKPRTPPLGPKKMELSPEDELELAMLLDIFPDLQGLTAHEEEMAASDNELLVVDDDSGQDEDMRGLRLRNFAKSGLLLPKVMADDQTQEQVKQPKNVPVKFIPDPSDKSGQKLRHYKDKHNEREKRRKKKRLQEAMAADGPSAPLP